MRYLLLTVGVILFWPIQADARVKHYQAPYCTHSCDPDPNVRLMERHDWRHNQDGAFGGGGG